MYHFIKPQQPLRMQLMRLNTTGLSTFPLKTFKLNKWCFKSFPCINFKLWILWAAEAVYPLFSSNKCELILHISLIVSNVGFLISFLFSNLSDNRAIIFVFQIHKNDAIDYRATLFIRHCPNAESWDLILFIFMSRNLPKQHFFETAK